MLCFFMSFLQAKSTRPDKSGDMISSQDNVFGYMESGIAHKHLLTSTKKLHLNAHDVQTIISPPYDIPHLCLLPDDLSLSPCPS